MNENISPFFLASQIYQHSQISVISVWALISTAFAHYFGPPLLTRRVWLDLQYGTDALFSQACLLRYQISHWVVIQCSCTHTVSLTQLLAQSWSLSRCRSSISLLLQFKIGQQSICMCTHGCEYTQVYAQLNSLGKYKQSGVFSLPALKHRGPVNHSPCSSL